MFVAHGADDRIVPVDHSRELVARLRSRRSRGRVPRGPRRGPRAGRGAPSVPDIVAASLKFIATTH